jgi:fibronectin-binding autotransporter adhesin
MKRPLFTLSNAVVLAVSLAAIVFDLTYSSLATAAVTTSGSVYDDRTNWYYIGYMADGSLRIDDAGVFKKTYSYIGHGSGCTGIARVTGTGSQWINAYLFVGDTSSGILNIEASGQVSNTYSTIGRNSGSTGLVTVTGSGSQLIGGFLYVGDSGSGILNIEASGQVSNDHSRIGSKSRSTGLVTVTGSGSQLIGGFLYVGDSGNGTLNIRDGGQFYSRDACLGNNSGSTGTVTVTGTGSTWRNNTYLYVGSSGSGTLNIQDGGQVSNDDGYLGYNSGSTGAATVTGTGSNWTNDGFLYVGSPGSGTLTVDNGGSATAQNLFASLGDLFGNGTIIAKGAVLDTKLVFDGTHGLSQSLAFGTGGALNLSVDSYSTLGAGHKGTGTLWIADGVTVASLTGIIGNAFGSNGTATVTGTASTWTNNRDLYVGNSGSGTLNIQAGGQVSNINGCIGYLSGSTGTAIVTGAGSKWTNIIDLCVGDSGSGTLTVENGGSVTASTLYASPGDLFGNGTITANGAILDSDLVFDGTHGLSQVFAFGTGGALNLSIDGNGKLGAGHKRAGTLRIADGKTVESSGGVIGRCSGSTGTATVTGNETKWITGNLRVGDFGHGTLNIQAGGQISSYSVVLGLNPGSTGTATVTCTGSVWTNNDTLYVGQYGNGTLNIQSGGQVSNSLGYLGYHSGGTGFATVTGMGSKWGNSDILYVGYYMPSLANSGKGTLNVADGGQITAKALYVGSQSTVKLNVSGNDMLVFGDATTPGTLNSRGKINFYANASLPAGTYSPISEYASRAITWSGTGTYNGFGGTWNNTAKTFLVSAPTALNAGASDTVTTAERLLFADPISGKHTGASFGTITGSPNFSAMLMTPSELSDLTTQPGFAGSVLTGWNYTASLSGAEVMLSYDIGSGYQDPQIWRLHDSAWSLFTPDLVTYDSNGNLSFTVTDFSGYAVTAVPEPCTITMFGISVIGLLAHAWRLRKRIL